MEFVLAKLQPGASVPLKIFFALIEVAIIYAGIYFIRHRRKFFSRKSDDGESYASANLRMALVVLVWIHSVIITAVMIFEV
ncbi:MAG TPA: hypothetical protein VH170_01995 [Chthoniobacterales bacterium]|jgi:hypothetical protein|nr:hypothetical protein [Chthoniobacterales bacterium]